MEIHAAGGGIHYTVDQTKKGPINMNFFVNPRTTGTQFRAGTRVTTKFFKSKYLGNLSDFFDEKFFTDKIVITMENH